MKTNNKFILGTLLLVFAVLLELFWIQTGATVLGVFSLVIALIASGAYARAIPLEYTASDPRLHRFLCVLGLKN